MLNIHLFREKHKIFLSETVRPRALIFDMKHQKVDLNQFVLIRPLGPKIATPQGSHDLHRLIYGAT